MGALYEFHIVGDRTQSDNPEFVRELLTHSRAFLEQTIGPFATAILSDYTDCLDHASADESKKVVVTSPMNHYWYGLAETARARIITSEATKVLHESGNALDDGLATITDSYALGKWLDAVRSDVTGLMILIINQFIEVSQVKQ